MSGALGRPAWVDAYIREQEHLHRVAEVYGIPREHADTYVAKLTRETPATYREAVAAFSELCYRGGKP